MKLKLELILQLNIEPKTILNIEHDLHYRRH